MASDSPVAAPVGAPLRVLIADDSPVQRIFVEHALRVLGHEPLVACDGREAVTLCIRERPDVVLLDLEMPVLDGLGACREIRAAHLPHQPGIVFVTATHDEIELASCLEAGGDLFLNKPVSLGVLGAQLAAFARSRALTELVRAQAEELRVHHTRVAEELRVARDVFDRVLSYSSTVNDNARVVQADASSFAGDLVLTAESPSGVQYLFVGDCTGHGLPAALTAMPAASSFAALVKRGFDGSGILSGMNDRLQQTLPDGYFVAAALVAWDPPHRRLAIWNGGLPDLHIWRAGEGIVHSVASLHPPLGVLPTSETEFVPVWVPVEHDDRVLVYTDGVSESRDASGVVFGEDGVRRALAAGNLEPLDAVYDALSTFINAQQGDDIAIAELRCRAYAAPATRREAVQEPDAGEFDEATATGIPSGRVVLEVEAGALRVVDPLPIASQLARALPVITERGADVQVVLTELVANAVQHGVLGLPSSAKATPEGFADFYREVRQRTAAVRHGWVRVEISHTVRGDRNVLAIRVSDSGEGYSHDAIPAADDERHSGRGLHLVREMADHVRVLDEGRTVEATLSWQRRAG